MRIIVNEYIVNQIHILFYATKRKDANATQNFALHFYLIIQKNIF